MKREILIIIGTIIITLVVVRVFLWHSSFKIIDYVPILPTKDASVGTFKTIDCKDCNVLRITESVWNGPIAKAGPDKVWEILAKPGVKTSTSDWSLEIISVNENNLKLKLVGKIYQSGKQIVDPIVIPKWSKSEELNDNRMGGGSVWEFVYFQKTN